jgi:mannitol-specific phosphotransferase system IIBC component
MQREFIYGATIVIGLTTLISYISTIWMLKNNSDKTQENKTQENKTQENKTQENNKTEKDNDYINKLQNIKNDLIELNNTMDKIKTMIKELH